MFERIRVKIRKFFKRIDYHLFWALHQKCGRAKKDGDFWRSEYIFTPLKRDLAEFAGMCQFHQTSPESHFTRDKVCSLMTPGGRKTLTDGKFIETKNGQKKEIVVNSEEKFNRILANEFYIKPNFNG